MTCTFAAPASRSASLRLSLPLLAFGLFSEASQASPLIWQDNSLSYLYGHNYKVDGTGNDIENTITFEHASGWSWGDMFLFVDNKWSAGLHGNAGHSYYGEFSPRLSLGKVSGHSMVLGPITDVLVAATYERGEGTSRRYLLGPGFDLKIPGFDWVQLNTYYRRPDGISGKASGQWQINPVWSMTFPFGVSDIRFDGYAEWYVNDVGRKGSSNYVASSFHFNPQLKYDLGKALKVGPRQLYVGVEYDYWSDKYGIEDSHGFPTDQNTASLLVKAHF